MHDIVYKLNLAAGDIPGALFSVNGPFHQAIRSELDLAAGQIPPAILILCKSPESEIYFALLDPPPAILIFLDAVMIEIDHPVLHIPPAITVFHKRICKGNLTVLYIPPAGVPVERRAHQIRDPVLDAAVFDIEPFLLIGYQTGIGRIRFPVRHICQQTSVRRKPRVGKIRNTVFHIEPAVRALHHSGIGVIRLPVGEADPLVFLFIIIRPVFAF